MIQTNYLGQGGGQRKHCLTNALYHARQGLRRLPEWQTESPRVDEVAPDAYTGIIMKVIKHSVFRASRMSGRFRSWCCALTGTLLFSFLVSCGSQQGSLPASQQIQVGSELAAEQVINRHLAGDPRTLDPT